MRRYIPALLLALAAIAPFPLAGCDLITKMKGGGDDAGAIDAAALAMPAVDAAVAAATDTAPTPPTPLTPTPTGTLTTVRPVTVDGGKPIVVDAGTAKADGGPAPAPTPTLTIPNFFDAGGLKFDAGGFKPPWVK